MQQAHNIVRIALIDRNARIGALEHLCHKCLDRQGDVEREHLHAMHHHIGHLEIAQVQNAAQHVGIVLDHVAFGLQIIHRAAQLVMARARLFGMGIDAQQAQQARHQPLHRQGHRRKHQHDDADHRGHGQRETVGPQQRQRLGHDLGKHHHRRRHGQRRIDDPGFPEDLDQQARRQGGGEDIDHIIAQQDGADQPFLVAAELFHGQRPLVAAAGQLVNARP